MSTLSSPLAAQYFDVGRPREMLRAEQALRLREGWQRVKAQWQQAIERGDGKRLRGIMEEEVTLITPDGRTIEGRDSVAAHLLAEAKRLARWSYDVDAVSVHGGVGLLRGTAAIELRQEGGGNVPVDRPFVLALKEVQRDEWKLLLITGGEPPATLALAGPLACQPAEGDTVAVRARVRAGDGVPIPRASVVFEAMGGPGHFEAGVARTDEQGIAEGLLVTGPGAGTLALRLTVGGALEAPLLVELPVRAAGTGTCRAAIAAPAAPGATAAPERGTK
ncbi:MAG: DUF4440 domain-containing protein [Gemmatimonadales bacterium]|nr:DUF4440 domain-containing protein [Gemmatimonadales bacterium]